MKNSFYKKNLTGEVRIFWFIFWHGLQIRAIGFFGLCYSLKSGDFAERGRVVDLKPTFLLKFSSTKRTKFYPVMKEHKTLSENIDNLNKKSGNVTGLIKDIAYLDKIIGKEGVSKEMIQQEIVSFASQKAKVSINELQPIHTFSDENYTIVTNQLDVTGGVNQLSQLAYSFEKDFNFSRIVSMNFYTTKKNNISETLHLKMIFQNYENNK